MEENILKLLEEGGSDDIRLGYHLLKAVDQPTIPALALWKEVFRMVEEAGEINMFLYHMGNISVNMWRTPLQIVNGHNAATCLNYPSLKPIWETIPKPCPSPRLESLAHTQYILRSIEYISTKESIIKSQYKYIDP